MRLRRDVGPGSARPRVLLVDDHPGVLDRATAMLVDDFDVAGRATDGQEALRAARDIDPDVIVLDINMPGLDGFRTCRALQAQGSRAVVVFVSMAEDDEYVNEAFRCGGRGYVVKSQMLRDLGSAIDHVLADRLFAPSLAPLYANAATSGHATHLHGDEEPFLDSLARVFEQAAGRGDATCLIATESIRHGLEDRLRARGGLLESLGGRYLALDSYDAIRGFMRGGVPDGRLVAEFAIELDAYRQRVAGPDARLTVVGNIAGVLTAEGHPAAAMALERLWNQVTRGLPFFTVCFYASACFEQTDPELWSQICGEHGAVGHSHDI